MRGREWTGSFKEGFVSCCPSDRVGGLGVHDDLVTPHLLYPIGCSMSKFCGSCFLARIQVSNMSLGALFLRVMRLIPRFALFSSLGGVTKELFGEQLKLAASFTRLNGDRLRYFTLSKSVK